MIIAMVLLKASSDKSIANSAPRNEPIIAGMDKKRIIFHLIKSYLKNAIKNVIKNYKFCNRMSILFFPLDMEKGKHKKNNIGKEMSDPPAEITLMKPTRIPVINSIIKLLKDM